MRPYEPLTDDHYAVTSQQKCAVCHEIFVAGAVTVLIPVDINPEIPGPKNVPALLAHWQCVKEMAR